MRHAARQLPSWLIFDVGQKMETKVLQIDVGEDLDGDELLSALREHASELESFLVDRLEYLSVRAVCDNFEVDAIESDGDAKYTMRYKFDWSAHYGCRDANDCGSSEEGISFKYSAGVVTIEREVVQPRFPNEEF